MARIFNRDALGMMQGFVQLFRVNIGHDTILFTIQNQCGNGELVHILKEMFYK